MISIFYDKQLFRFVGLLSFLKFSSLQKNASSYRNDFDIIQCVFELYILCPNFNFLYIFLLW